MVEVKHLDEGLDLASLLKLGLAHGADHLAGVSVNAGDQGVSELLEVVALLVGLHHDGLAARVAARQADDNLSALDAVTRKGEG